MASQTGVGAPPKTRREPPSWSIMAGVGYSYTYMVLAIILQVVVGLFLPHITIAVFLNPFYALATGRVVSAACDAVVYAAAIYYNSAGTARIAEEQQTNRIARWSIVALIFASAIFDLTGGAPIQTRIGAFILTGVLSGAVGGTLSRITQW